jgi:hypothetical protein
VFRPRIELGEEHDGIIELPADAPVGSALPIITKPNLDVAIRQTGPIACRDAS